MFQFRKSSIKETNSFLSKSSVSITLDDLLQLRFSAERLNWFKSHSSQSAHVGTTLSRSYGRGMEFAEVRNYQAGDDIRLINWQMTARTGKPYTKVYQEERERPVYLFFDTSPSMHFATRGTFKSVVAARSIALIAWAAFIHQDQVGGTVLGTNETSWISAKRQKKTLLQLLSSIANTFPLNTAETESAQGLSHALLQLQRRRIQYATICIASDFKQLNPVDIALLQTLSQHNTVILLFTYDHFERYAPPGGLYTVTNGEQQLSINTYDKNQAHAYIKDFETRWDSLTGLCRTSRCRFIPLTTDGNIMSSLNQMRLANGA